MGRKADLTGGEIRRVTDLRQQGSSYAEIARALGIRIINFQRAKCSNVLRLYVPSLFKCLFQMCFKARWKRRFKQNRRLYFQTQTGGLGRIQKEQVRQFGEENLRSFKG